MRPPCFPATVLPLWCSPSLGRVPGSQVPRRQRYYESTTTSHARYPLAYGFACGPRALLAVSSSLSRSTERRAHSMAWGFLRRLPLPAYHTAVHGISQVPGRSVCPSAVLQDPGRARRASPNGTIGAAPVSNRTKASACTMMSRFNRTASVPAVYASREMSPFPRKTGFRLVASLYREGLNPLDRYERFQMITSSFSFPRLGLSLAGSTAAGRRLDRRGQQRRVG